MKRTLFLTLLFLTQLTFGQSYEITSEGMYDAGNIEKTYLVLNVPNKSAKELYDAALKFVHEIVKNPDWEIKSEIDAELIKFHTSEREFLVMEHLKAKIDIHTNFMTVLHFQDGKVKFEITDLKIYSDSGEEVVFKTKMIGVGYGIYNKKGVLKKPELKADIEEYFNTKVKKLKSNLTGTSDDW